MNSLLLLCTLFLLASPLPTTHSLPFSTYQTLFSLSHSLLTRVATLRQSRGDLRGSIRAKAIADKFEPGLGLNFWKFTWSVGWDYLKNYAWRDMSTSEMFGAVSDMNELMRGLTELTRLGSEERVVWVQRNYGSVLRSSKSLLARLLKVFRRSGPLREMIETLQQEVVEGDLLRDCLEVGGNDLKGFIQILKDIALQSSSTTGRSEL